jgi:hypothetical protein
MYSMIEAINDKEDARRSKKLDKEKSKEDFKTEKESKKIAKKVPPFLIISLFNLMFAQENFAKRREMALEEAKKAKKEATDEVSKTPKKVSPFPSIQATLTFDSGATAIGEESFLCQCAGIQ